MEVQAKPPTTKGPTDWFTGDVYVDPIAQNQGPSPMSRRRSTWRAAWP